MDKPMPTRRRVVRLLLSVLLLLGCGYGLLLAGQAYLTLHDLRVLAADPRAALQDRVAFDRARRATLRLRALLGPLPQLAGHLAALPLLGPSLQALDPGLTAFEQTLAALQVAGPPLLPLLSRDQPPAELLQQPATWQQLAAAEPDLRRAALHAAAVDAALRRMPAGELLPAPLAEAVPLLGLVLPLAETAHFAALLAPAVPPLLPLLAAESPPSAADFGRLLAGLPAAAELPADLTPAALRTRSAWDRLPAAGLPASIAAQLDLLRAGAALAPPLSRSLSIGSSLTPLLAPPDGLPQLPTERFVRLQAPLQPQLQLLQTDLLAAERAWVALPAGAAPELQGRVHATLQRTARAVAMLQLLPLLLGSEQPRPTLLLALSNDEQRPGGGFLTSAGLVVLDAGRFALPQMEDSLQIVPPPYRASPPAPPELAEAMRIYRWFFRDANWSPDFRESARVAGLLYAQSGRGTPLQTIALDLTALTELVDLLGPLEVAASPSALNAADVHDFLRRAHDVNSDDNGPAVSALLNALFVQLQRQSGRLPELALLLADLAERRHLLIVSDDPRVAALVHSLGWDGALSAGAHDYLALIEANVGYTKTSAALRSSLHYQVDLRAPLNPQATLTVTQQLDLDPQSSCPPLVEPDYAALMNACHRGLVQLLVPRGAAVISTDLPAAAIGWLWDRPLPAGGALRVQQVDGLVDFAHYYALLPGQRRTAVLHYSLPAGVLSELPGGGWRYTLRLQKQVSQPPLSIVLQLQLPPGFRLRDADEFPQQLRLDGTTELSFDIVPTAAGAAPALPTASR